MYEQRIDEQACALLSLLTHAAWSPDLPAPLPRQVIMRMMKTGALQGLVLRDMSEIEAEYMERARLLLTRVQAVWKCIEAYRGAGYRLLVSGREGFPQELYVLGDKRPLFLFARGNEQLLRTEKISVAGSRRIVKETRNAALDTGARIALDGLTLVSGGAQGVDEAAQQGALEAGGSAIIVPALPAEQLLHRRSLRQALGEGRLLLLCDTLPDEPFSALKALARNHVIYALGKATLVVAARDGKGGSWRGASDCLRGGWRPVFCWEGENEDTLGCRALERIGARQYSVDSVFTGQLTSEEQLCFWQEQRGKADAGED